MVGAVGAASQLLSTLLQKLASASSTSSSSSSSSTATASVSGFQQALPGDTKKSLTPPLTPTLNGDILSALIALQAQTGDTAQSSASGDASSPVQQLFSAMDSDGDGEVSQTEMESYIEKQGGTQAQADALYNSLDQGNSSGGISEDQMQTAVTNARQSHAHHHRHHGTGNGQEPQGLAGAFMQALDANNDGSVSEDEFNDYMAKNGASADYAKDAFAQLDQDNSGALTSADFAKALSAYQSPQSSSSPTSMMASLLNQLSGMAGSITA